MTVEEFKREYLNESPTIEAHTSGSTGTPKVIQLERRLVKASAHATNRFFDIDSQSILLSPLSVDYIAGKMMVVRAIESGAKLITVKPSSRPLEGWENIEGERVRLAAIVPMMVEGVLEDEKSRFLDHVIIGGAPLNPRLERLLRGAPFRAWETYGMTETCSHVALRDVSRGCEMFEAIGENIFSQDDRNCLVINGEIDTNDVVDLIDEKRFKWLGRADNIVNSGGVKLSPEILERRVREELDEDVEFYFTSRRSERYGEEFVSVIITDSKEEGEKVKSELKKACEKVLGRYERPKEFLVDTAPEVTGSGKIKRKKY